jgi:methylated-DNA-[protein]-cysteine S-methyltransferase
MAEHAGEIVVATPPFGATLLAWSAVGLTRVRLLAEAEMLQSADRLPSFVVDAIDTLRAYAAGTPTTFSAIPLDEAGQSDFHRAIYAALRRVPYGETTTYGALAQAAGFDAGASRAVGVAMGRNPWPVIVPCHRVMASGGKMGGFSAPGGTDTKARLLRLEGARHAAAAPLLPGLDV